MENREVIIIKELTEYLNQLIKEGLDVKTIYDLILKHHLRHELKIGGTNITNDFIKNYIDCVMLP
jgi:hypothetical protein